MRRQNYPEPYEALKRLTRGTTPTMADIETFIDGLEVSDDVKAELHALRPETYTGLAVETGTFSTVSLDLMLTQAGVTPYKRHSCLCTRRVTQAS